MTRKRSAGPGAVLRLTTKEHDKSGVPPEGKEIRKDRLWMVVSELAFSRDTRWVIAVPVTNGIGDDEISDTLKVPMTGTKGVTGSALVYEPRAFDLGERAATQVGTASPQIVTDVRERLGLILGLVLPGG